MMAPTMNWKQLLSDLREVMTLDEIAAQIGLKSRSAVHAIANGHQKSVTYEVGVQILRLHKSMTRAITTARKVSA